MFLPAELIKKKKYGGKHSQEEINFLIQSYSQGNLPDYQMAAWLMAVYFQGMDLNEAAQLTQAMIDSGERIKFPNNIHPIDKHSTGGVGDKTSLILGPIVAVAQVPVPMIAGRGLGHTGGTLDKLESISGFNVNFSLEQFKKQVEEFYICIMGQTKEICPADKKLYALRDVTGTVDSQPLICGSIMSKKIAEGIKGLVLDVKVGTGAFMKSVEEAESLANSLSQIGNSHGLEVISFLTNMNQPLGRFVGNSLEIIECIDILKNREHLVDQKDFYADTRELSLQLAGAMIYLGKKQPSLDEGIKQARQILESGQAYEKFLQLIELQGGEVLNKEVSHIHLTQEKETIYASQEGYIKSYNGEQIGVAGIQLKAGRTQTSDSIDHSAGIELHKKIGDFVKKDDPLFTVYGKNPSLFDKAKETLYSCITWDSDKINPPSLVYKIIHN